MTCYLYHKSSTDIRFIKAEDMPKLPTISIWAKYKQEDVRNYNKARKELKKSSLPIQNIEYVKKLIVSHLHKGADMTVRYALTEESLRPDTIYGPLEIEGYEIKDWCTQGQNKAYLLSIGLPTEGKFAVIHEPKAESEAIDIKSIVQSVSYNVTLESGESLVIVDFDDALFMMEELHKKLTRKP